MAALFILAGCPPIDEGPTTSDATETGTESNATTEGQEESNTQPTDTTPPVTTTADTDTTGTMSGTESNTGMTETGTDPTTGTVEPECDANKPCGDGKFCVDEVCVGCDQADEGACAGADPNAPVCAEGTCVQCTADSHDLCTGTSPVCVDNACTACTQHSECPDSACNFETGGCFDAQFVLYVDRTATCDGALGTMEAPFCKIGDAFPAMMASEQGVGIGWTIKIKAGNYIEEPLLVPDGSLVTFTRWGDGAVKLRAPDDAGDTLTVQNASTVYLDRIEFKSNPDYNGVVCAGAKVYADDVLFTANRKQGYESTDCETRINRSVVFDNDSGGLASYGPGTTMITNSYITSNGSQSIGEYGGVLTAQGNEMHLVFTTVANGLSQTGAASLFCNDDAGATEVRNSVLIGFALPSVICPTATITTSAVDEGAVDGDGNVIAVKADLANFFNPMTAGVYTAIAGTPLENLAVWKEGDPKTDFNGTARVNMDGGMDFAGADKP